MYAKYMREVAAKLFEGLSLGLGLGRHVLKEAAGGEEIEYLLKINYYPPCPRPDLALGVVAHTDLSAITILVPNEVPGLQVLKDEHWIDAKYIPNALIIHIGDQIEVIIFFHFFFSVISCLTTKNLSIHHVLDCKLGDQVVCSHVVRIANNNAKYNPKLCALFKKKSSDYY